MRYSKWLVAVLVAVMALGAIGTYPFARNEMTIGGGHGDAAGPGTEDAGGADFEDDGTITTDSTITADGGLVAGQDGALVGVLTLWEGASGAPAYARLAAEDGTAWYFFVESDGTLKYHTTVPTQDSDGDDVGSAPAPSSTFDENGIDITDTPASDMDMDGVSFIVTGNPIFGWDESEDAFNLTHPLVVTDDYPHLKAINNNGWFKIHQEDASGSSSIFIDPEATDGVSDQSILFFRNSDAGGEGYFRVNDPGQTGASDYTFRITASTGTTETNGILVLVGEDAGGALENYAIIQKAITDNTDGSEDGELFFKVMVAGTSAEAMRIHDDTHVEMQDDLDVGGGITAGTWPDLDSETEVEAVVTDVTDFVTDNDANYAYLIDQAGTKHEAWSSVGTGEGAYRHPYLGPAAMGTFQHYDFFGDAIPGEWTETVSGTGSSIALDGTVIGGAVKMYLGTTYLAAAKLTLGDTTPYYLVDPTDGECTVISNIKCGPFVDTEVASWRVGFSDNLGTFGGGSFAQFQAIEGSNESGGVPQWICRSRDGSTAETTNSSVLSTGWHLLRITCTASDVTFWIDDIDDDDTPIATHSTNIPASGMFALAGYGLQTQNPGTNHHMWCGSLTVYGQHEN